MTVIFLLAVAAAGCGGDAAEAPTPGGAGSPADEAASVPAGMERDVAQARQLVADNAGISVDQVVAVEAEQVTWNDGALGCPEPGQAYTQALVDGYRIVLDAAGERVHVHGSEGGAPFICEDPEPRG